MPLSYDNGLTCSLQCSNLDAALAWYKEKLGFEVDYKMDEMGWAEMRTHITGVNVGLSQVEAPEVKGGATLTFGVKDIAAARDTLESQNVRFDGETMTIPDMVALATFFDADGNKLMLYQLLSHHS